jgi:LCP family protein required for cell wall assembly
MTDDRERGAEPGAVRSRSGPPSVPTRVVVPDPGEPGRRGGIAPSMVPLARKRAVRRGLRPGGAAATTEPMRDLVGAAVKGEAAGPTAPPPRGPSRAALAPPRPAPDHEPTERMPSAPVPALGTAAAPALRSLVVPAAGEADLDWAEPGREKPAREKPAKEKPAKDGPTAVKPARERTAQEKPRPAKPTPPKPVRQGTAGRGAWTWGRTVRLLATAMSALVVLVSGLAWGATSWFETAVRQIAALDPTSSAIVDPAAQAGDQNFLVVGSDTRVGAAPTDDVGDPNDVPGARSDTVMIVHVPAGRSGMTVVSFPRDLEIDRPACERWDSVSGAYTPQTIPEAGHVKLNSAYQVGGPRCVTKVVQQLSGLAVNHFLAVDFSGFKDMVDAVGGVPVCIDKPMHDTILGTVIPRAGTTVLTGDQALNFVRARHVVGDPTSDYGRIHRQQLFLSALLRQSLSAGTLLNVGKLSGLVDAVSRSTYGENIEADQLLSLGQSMSSLDAHRVTFTTVPTTGVANERGNEVLRDADDRTLFGDIIEDRPLPGQPGAAPPPPPVPADRVALRLVDARTDSGSDSDTDATDATDADDTATSAAAASSSGSTGSAGSRAEGFRSEGHAGHGSGSSAPSESTVAGALRSYGFTVAPGTGAVGTGTVIRFSPDQAGAAATLQRAVPGSVLTPEPAGTGTLVLQLGDDFAGRVVNPTAPPPAPAAPVVNAADAVCS